jgi:glycosidase
MKTLKLIAVVLSIHFSSNCQNQPFTTPLKTVEWSKNASIYEVNVRQFSKEGTFKALEKELPRLKAMGVDILWLMPINPIGVKNRKGSLGSYYAVKDYMAVNPEFGTKSDFDQLVKAAHALNLKIIIDWVANHTSPDNIWVEQGHKDWYTLDSTGNLQPTIGTDWWDVADLNYDNKDMRKAMIESMKFWVKTSDIDGFRCDVADWVPVDFWNEARKELDEVKPVFMLAEAENPAHHTAAFDMSYGWEFHSIMNQIAQGKKNVNDIRKYVAERSKFPTNAYRMNFTSNHDENSWNGTEMERMGDARFAMAVLAATFEGMNLIYNGQETSLDRRLLFFEKDRINWDKMDLVDFYTKINNLKEKNQALWNGNFGGDLQIISPENNKNVLVYTREKNGQKVLVIVNLSAEKQTLNFENSSLKGKYINLFTGKKKSISTGLNENLAPWGYVVYSK